jgi:hypothetical protein
MYWCDVVVVVVVMVWRLLCAHARAPHVIADVRMIHWKTHALND